MTVDSVEQPAEQPSSVTSGVTLLVGFVALAGLLGIVWAVATIGRAPLNSAFVLLVLLTIVSSRFVIQVPGQPATVSVSEVFVFAIVMLFGPAAAVLTVALDGVCVSLTQRNRRFYRTLFNVGEPAVSVFLGGSAFFVVVGTAPFATGTAAPESLLLPSALMSLTYFLSNTLLQSAAVAAENGLNIWRVWRQHAWQVGINYYAAGALAVLAVRNGSRLDLELVGLVGPLLILSYVAYKAAAGQVDAAQRHVAEIEGLYRATVETLAIAVDAKDQVTHGHIRRVQRHTVAVARALGVSDPLELKALHAASLLHDIGKLAVPDYVLNKPGALTASEFEKIKLHAPVGANILSKVDFPYPVVPIVRHHHEQWAGEGYPDNIRGDDIPLGARIVSVVDCFDALTSDRPYRRKMTDQDATNILLERRGTLYDPRVVDAFIDMIPVLREEDRRIDGTNEMAIPPSVIAKTDAAQIASRLRDDQLSVVAAILREQLPIVVPDAEACFYTQACNGEALAASRWTDGVAPLVQGHVVPLGEGLVGWVAAHRDTIINSHSDLDLGEGARAMNLGACTAIPVFAFGTLVGVLTFYLPKPRRFTPEQIPQLGIIAQHIGLALVTAGSGLESAVFSRPDPDARLIPARRPVLAGPWLVPAK